MKSDKKAAIIVGSLFLLALIPNVFVNEIQSSILDQSDYLASIYSNKHLFIFSNLLNVICGFAMIFIPIFLYGSVNEKYKSMAKGYIVFRGLEGILFLFIAIKTLSLVGLNQVSLGGNGLGNNLYYEIGNQIKSEIHWSNIVYLICFCSGALLFYTLLFKSKMIPNWMSIWGIISILILSIGTIMAMFSLGVFETMPTLRGMVFFAPPIALNEFVLSFWLIFKGFKSSVSE